MEQTGNIIGMSALGFLAWQDFRSRSISWWLLPIVVAGLLLGGASRWNLAELGKDFLLNATFLLVQFAFVWLWVCLRQRKFVRLIDRQIGLGDVLFLVAVALSFSPGPPLKVSPSQGWPPIIRSEPGPPFIVAAPESFRGWKMLTP